MALQSGRRDSNSRRSAWKADTLPTELLPHMLETNTQIHKSNAGPGMEGGGFEPPKRDARQVYSLIPLATRTSLRPGATWAPLVSSKCPSTLSKKSLRGDQLEAKAPHLTPPRTNGPRAFPTRRVPLLDPSKSVRAGTNKSWRSDSNQQPAAYKAAALPIELRQHGAPRLWGGWLIESRAQHVKTRSHRRSRPADPEPPPDVDARFRTGGSPPLPRH